MHKYIKKADWPGLQVLAWIQIIWHNVKCFKIKILNLHQIRYFYEKSLLMSLLSIYECLTSSKKLEKTKWTGFYVLHDRQFFWRNAKCFIIKILNLDKKRLLSKKPDYVPFEHLWMSNFMQKIRRNEWTGLHVLNDSRFSDVIQNAT